MNYFDQKTLPHFRNNLMEIQHENKALESEKETLFKESSTDINYLLRQLTRLASFFEEKNSEYETLKRDSGNWTKSSQNSKQNLFQTHQIIIKSSKQLGYSDQTLRQKLDQIIEREILLHQKILLFIKKNDERKQKYEQLLQREYQLKQKDNLIQQLEKTLQLQKDKYKTQLNAEIAQSSKLLKNKIQSQYNKKITRINEEYEQKTLDNIEKYEKLIQVLKQEKQKSFNLMKQQVHTLEKLYQHKLKQAKTKTPEKARRTSLQREQKLKSSSKQKKNSENLEKFKAQSQRQIKNANEKNHQLQGKIKNLLIEIQKFKQQNSKLTTIIQRYQIENQQKMNRISENEHFIAQKSVELHKIAQDIDEKNKAYQKLQKKNQILEAKLANMTDELKRSKKSNQQIRQITNKNLRGMEKQLEDTKKELLESKKLYFSLNAQLDSFKHEIKQKQIRIESMDRQLERTKNYNQILTKQNQSLRQVIQKLSQNRGLSSSQKLQYQKNFIKDQQSLKDTKQIKNHRFLLSTHTRSLQNIFEHRNETSHDYLPEERIQIITSRLHEMSDQSFKDEMENNSLGRELILPLKESQSNKNLNLRQTRNSLQGPFLHNYNFFETTFSPLISPNFSLQNTGHQNNMNQPLTNILSWNPQSPINQIESVYNSLNWRNRQIQHENELKSDELIEKMSSLSKEKERQQISQAARNSFGLLNMETVKFEQQDKSNKIEREVKVPKLRPLMKYANRSPLNEVEVKQPKNPSQDRVLNLSFEEVNSVNPGPVFKKKVVASREKLDGYKGRINGFK